MDRSVPHGGYVSLETARDMVMVQHFLTEKYGPRHYYTVRYHKEEFRYSGLCPYWLVAFLKTLTKPSAALDIGPGYGTLACLASIHGADVTTIDRVPMIIEGVRDEYKLNMLIGDVERQPIPGTYDAIIMTEVLEHFNFSPTSTLVKIRMALKPGGRVYLSTPDAATWGRIIYYPDIHSLPLFPSLGTLDYPVWRDEHIWQYTFEELESVIITSGLKILQVAHSNSPGGNHFNLEIGLA